MSPLPPITANGGIAQRRGERGSICTQPMQETVPETRVGGVPAGGRLTLEQLLEGVWEGLRAGGTATCPLCHGHLGRATAGAVARCEDCGSTLA